MVEETLQLQKMLFDIPTKRKNLVEYSSRCKKSFVVQVFRNHSFELVEHTVDPFLDYAGFGISFEYSGYDDSFSFSELNPRANLILLWIDTTRYQGVAFTGLLDERISSLRAMVSCPILVIPFGMDIAMDQPGVTVWNLSEIEQELGSRFVDRRVEKFSGTPLSSEALIRISRVLGLRYFPALLRPRIKAIVVDLDNTLYEGVLGEDGIEGVKLNGAHLELQGKLKRLSAEGFFLCAISKNDPEPVSELFQNRRDFPLRMTDFTKICASWNPKADAIEEIARFLNIDSSAMLFLDDNIGELTAVKMAFPEIHIILADPEGAGTVRALREYPGLLKLVSSREDELRKTDTQANQIREEMRVKMDTKEYIRSLDISLTYYKDCIEQAARISELANKTNQFIFNYKRYSHSEIERLMASENSTVVSVSMRDKLSDSGVIGVCIGTKQNDYVEIEECFVSCRALGRGIDSVIVLEAIRQVMLHLQSEKAVVDFQSGERNKPAEQFVHRYFNKQIKIPSHLQFDALAELEGLCTIRFES